MPDQYFSEREGLVPERNVSEISPAVWGGLVADLNARISNGAFGIDFPDDCPDGRGVSGTNTYTLGLALHAEVPGAPWPITSNVTPPAVVVMDMLEFFYEHVAEPIQQDYHSYFGHHHLGFNRQAGQDAFRSRINRIFSRNGVAFEITPSGRAQRTLTREAEGVLSLRSAITGDAEMDRLLQLAVDRFLDPDINVRRDALEKLWDAWERLKTLLPGKDKRESTDVLLRSAARSDAYYDLLNNEALALTRIGNTFRIRHSETTQQQIEHPEQLDYLFLRLAALVRLLLTALPG